LDGNYFTFLAFVALLWHYDLGLGIGLVTRSGVTIGLAINAAVSREADYLCYPNRKAVLFFSA